VLAAHYGFDAYTLPVGITTVTGSLIDALRTPDLALATRDAYVAGTPAMMPGVEVALENAGIDDEHIHVDSFGM